MRVLIVRGAFGDMYEPSWCRALNDLGEEAFMFDAHEHLMPGTAGRVERRLLWGPGILRVRSRLMSRVKEMRPHVTLLYQGHYFDRDFVNELRRITFVVGYHNDDPFGPRGKMLRYRHLMRALPSYDGLHVYRPCNVSEAQELGVQNVAVLMPYYLPWLDYPRLPEVVDDMACDLMYAGHAEDDLRGTCISYAVQSGIRVRLYGEAKYWRAVLPSDVYASLSPLAPVRGDNYRKAVSAAKIAACFFSKWNRDQYTRRAFEIPACGTFLLSERTDAMLEIYSEGIHAAYFDGPEEFLHNVRYYLSNESLRNKIARAGLERVRSMRHDIHSRMKQWRVDVDRWRNA